jgi:Proteasome stabiliser
VYGADTTLRLKQAGMEFAVWVFKQAADAQLAPMAPVVLQGLLRLLDAGAQAFHLILEPSQTDR